MKSARLYLCLIITTLASFLCVACPVLATEPDDTTQQTEPVQTGRMELLPGYCYEGFTFAIQGSYLWSQYFSTDLMLRFLPASIRKVSTLPFNVHAGATFFPIRELFLQGSLAYGGFNSSGLHDSFNGSILFGLRGGAIAPVGLKTDFVIAISNLWAIDRDYCDNCGRNNGPNWTPKYSDEIRSLQLLDIGIGFRF